MTHISRADLLQLLPDAPIVLQAELAELLGFGIITQTSTEMSFPLIDESLAEVEKPERKTPKPIHAEYQPVMWYIEGYQARHSQPSTSAPKYKVRTHKRENQPVSAPLFSPAEFQLLWDQCLKQQHSTQQPDIPAVVRMIAEVKPFKTLPKLKREASHQETVLFLDRSDHLAPIWQDQLEIATSLQKLLGRENCQVLLMLNGLSGTIQKRGSRPAENWSFEQLPESARLLFVTDLGYYSQQTRAQQAWQQKLEQLVTLGNFVCVLNPASRIDHRFAFEQLALDKKSSQFAKLQQIIASCLQAKLPRIRQLRQIIAGGCLADELTLWNHQHRNDQHPARQTTALSWRLDPKYLYQWAMLDQLTPRQQQQCAQLHARWRASMPMETEGLEQLIEEALDPEHQQADASLLDFALDQYEQNSGQQTGVYRWLVSQKELFQALEQYTMDIPKWQRLNRHAFSAITQAEKNQSEYLAISEPFETRYLYQRGSDLICSATKGSGLIASHAIFDVDNGRHVEVGSRYAPGTLKLRTLQADMQLMTLSQPDWSKRFWHDDQGIFAAHCENALFFLQPASADRPKAQWECRYNPWSWASATGIDEYGLWADLQVKTVKYRLRWIKPGQFMMGSPENEVEREENETQHRVTLTQGYWLGETSCTQAFWLAVMGRNPSHFSHDLQLPVESISWHDCQTFLVRLVKLLPGFAAQLPTEAQWEYACRAGTTTTYWWGDTMNQRYANNNSKTEVEEKYPANKFGLKSTSGNLYEWCADWRGHYPTGAVVDPTGSLTGQSRVLRGGSWYSSGRNLRSAGRSALVPDYRYRNAGFRLAGGIDPQASKPLYIANCGPWSGQAGDGIERAEGQKD